MGETKDLKLVNIYIKIHNKKVLTLDDLAYLAKYNPECFKKTCDNLLYKIPEAKPIVKPDDTPPAPKSVPVAAEAPKQSIFELTTDERMKIEHTIIQFFDGMKGLEAGEIDALQNVDARHVKELMGELFMENQFPHNDRDKYYDFTAANPSGGFNVKA